MPVCSVRAAYRMRLTSRLMDSMSACAMTAHDVELEPSGHGDGLVATTLKQYLVDDPGMTG